MTREPDTNSGTRPTEMDFKRLVEECGEVIQAASKVMRFGVRGSYCDGTPNMAAVTNECGDLLACIDRLGLDPQELEAARLRKHEKLAKVEKYELGFDSELTREQREELHGAFKP